MGTTNFCRISYNSFDTRGFPWIKTIKEGLAETYCCNKCSRKILYPEGDIKAVLEYERNKVLIRGRGNASPHRAWLLHPLQVKAG